MLGSNLRPAFHPTSFNQETSHIAFLPGTYPTPEIIFYGFLTPRVFPLDWTHEIPHRSRNRLRHRPDLEALVEAVVGLVV